MDQPTRTCDWCRTPLTCERPGMLVNRRWQFHATCLMSYKRSGLAVKVKTSLPIPCHGSQHAAS
jgi:hypothetical protein